MDKTIHLSESKLPNIVDVLCALMIGLGIGGLIMYWYTINNPQDLIQITNKPQITTQQIQTLKNNDNSSSGTSTKTPVATDIEQI